MTNSISRELGTATYSPEDNKIRFYALERLSPEDYQRARAAGFIWAPRQELFVAPMWTPEREDLMIEWCGDLGDEDKSLVARAEERADRFSDYSTARADDAQRAHAAVSAIADNIPLGQPILVGHHSERHARKDAERIEGGMRRAVKAWEQSQYWKDRAASAIRHAKYKEAPGVRARRIKKIEADLRRVERARLSAERSLKLWLRPMTLEQAYQFAGGSTEGHLGCAPNEHGSHWSAYNVLERGERRYKSCPEWTVEQVQERAREVFPAIVAKCDRWIAHYSNRLTYERAMLDESGGTAADRVKPEVGGACRCWCNDGWSKIQKVNKVSVTVLRNFHNGGADFSTTVPFDELRGVLSAAQVQELRQAGRLVAESDRGFHTLDAVRPAPAPVKPPEDKGAAAPFEAMRDQLQNGGIKVLTAPNLFPTPAPVAAQLADLADLFSGAKVLEPSAGTGVLVREAISRGVFRSDVHACELNRDLARGLEALTPNVYCGDFLALAPSLPHDFDRVILNPPFDHGSDIDHVRAAFDCLAEDGILVAVVPAGPKQRQAYQEAEWFDLPAGSFKDQGTGVNTAIIVWTK